jgi:hypothetical protein
MMPFAVRAELGWLLAVLALVLAFAAGWAAQGWRKDAEIARLNEAQQMAQAQAASAASRRLADAQRKNDDLTGALSAAESRRIAVTEEKDREIRRLTSGRRCLDAAVVRVLNPPAEPGAAALPEAGGEPVSTDAAFATDTDVGTWIAACQQSYDTCRGRLDAVAAFYKDLPSE